MSDLFSTGIRPAVDQHLLKLAAEKRDYGEYWSASSGGYCMRKVIFDRLGVPPVAEDARKQRVFSSGDIFHEWLQRITKETGLSIAQELELQDEDLMIRGHIDDLVLVTKKTYGEPELVEPHESLPVAEVRPEYEEDHLILYDYKTQNSRAFSYKRPEMSRYHKMQLGTYMYMLRNGSYDPAGVSTSGKGLTHKTPVEESRILLISKDDLRMEEKQLLWTPALEKEIYEYWSTLNGYWKERKLPRCTCADYEGGFMAREKFNPYYFNDEPCSLAWLSKCKAEGLIKDD